MAGDLPGAVLFACTQNVIRSVMAEAIMKHFYGHKVYAASCGLKPGEPDPFVAAVMDEMGIDVANHRPQGFDDLEDSSFDVVISLSPEAHHRALEMTRAALAHVDTPELRKREDRLTRRASVRLLL